MEAPRDRESKLASAKKKLKKFKSQKATGSPAATAGKENSRPPVSEADFIFDENATPPKLSKNGLPSEPPPISPASESSAVESILQLSSQLNGLLDSSTDPDITREHNSNNDGDRSNYINHARNYTNGISGAYSNRSTPNQESELEILQNRNRDLAEKIRQLQQKNTQLTRTQQIQAEHLSSLEKQLSASESETSNKLRSEIQNTKEQLQVHIQTIGILVEEKQTLQNQLNNLQRNTDKKSDDLDDLTSRLKASRLRVGDLEKQMAQIKSERNINDRSKGDQDKLVNRLQSEHSQLKSDHEDLSQHKSQLEQQLHIKIEQTSQLESRVGELQAKLDVSQAYLQQVTNGEAKPGANLYEEQISEIQSKNNQLHLRNAELEESIQRVSIERNQTIEQYTQIINSLQRDNKQLQSEIDGSRSQFNVFERQISDLKQEITGLQTQLTDSDRHEHMDTAETQSAPQNGFTAEQVAIVVQQYETLRLQYEAAYKNLETLTSDNQHLSSLLNEKEGEISVLENSIDERLQSERDTWKKLLESNDGDRTALSRALTQNSQIKQQLEQLEDKFVMMSEVSMKSATELESERYISKQLHDKLEETEHTLNTTQHQLTDKLQYIAAHEEQLRQVSKMSLQQQQLVDRIRHYEAQIQVVETLQNELDSSQQLVHTLSQQNTELRQQVVNQSAFNNVTISQLETSSQPTNQSVNDIPATNSLSGNNMAAHSQLENGYENSENQPVATNGEKTSSNDKTSQANPPSDETDQSQAFSRQSSQSQAMQSEIVQSALSQLESEKAALSHRCEELMQENRKLTAFLSQDEQADTRTGTQLRNALNSLQDKFTRVMNEKAELSDFRERLEYENLQLQAESETINEYICLYHQQRQLIKQRAHQHQQYIQRLVEDRDKTINKFTELQHLVLQLLQNNDASGLVDVSKLKRSLQPEDGPLSSTQHPDTSNEMQTEMWPDFESNSDESQVEAIINESEAEIDAINRSEHLPADQSDQLNISPNNQSAAPMSPSITHNPVFRDSASPEQAATARRILYLLEDIRGGNSHKQLDMTSIVNCSHCNGPVIQM